MENAAHRNPAIAGNQGGTSTARLRLFFLAPLAVAIAATIGLFVLEFYLHQQEDIEHEVVRLRAAAEGLYRDTNEDNAEMLGAVMEMLRRDEGLRAALLRRDRGELLKRSAPLFAALRKDYRITHLYFSGPDRVNLLRVHQPERYGDRIDRHTTLEAERSGAVAHGLELGPLGSFTMRLVAPWYADAEQRRLIGFVELGTESEHVLEMVHDFLAAQAFILLRKEFLDRAQWESWMKLMGRVPEWDRFPDVVLSAQGKQTMPVALDEMLREGGNKDIAAIILRRILYQPVFIPLQDVKGRNVGRLVVPVDISHKVDRTRAAIAVSSVFTLVAGGGLLGFFYWLTGRVGRRLESHEHMLAELAMRDGLTGLLNHRTFYATLESEVGRAARYGAPLSLLMLDIDHFKQVNDTHGHIAGDRILAELSAVVGGQVRKVDSVCRYGGEELSVILPETGMEDAAHMAERIRLAVESHRFDTGSGQSIAITVSIGAAALRAEETSAQQLVAAADAALYSAKTGGRNRICWEEPAAPPPET